MEGEMIGLARTPAAIFCLAVLAWLAGGVGADRLARAQSPAPPDWAYPLNPDGPPKRPADDGVPRHVPGSQKAYKLSEITFFNVADWHPEAHPPMPAIVAHGRAPNVYACGMCHYPNGQGRPENAALAGLRADYIIQQIGEYRSGRRRGSQPAMLAPGGMIKVAAHASASDIKRAAEYFAGLTYRPWIRVVETSTVPKTVVAGVSTLTPAPGGGTEPIGDRIIEVPESPERTELRDASSGFVAYVPVGSIQRGDKLVHALDQPREPCTSCHGDALKGLGTAPPLAGRSPSSVFRQLYDIQTGSRHGPAVEMMRSEVEGMTQADLRDIAAYVAAQQP